MFFHTEEDLEVFEGEVEQVEVMDGPNIMAIKVNRL